jgi:hypothetical protein
MNGSVGLMASAVVFGNLMVMWGGGKHIYGQDESCFSNLLFFYDIYAQTWLPSEYVAAHPV